MRKSRKDAERKKSRMSGEHRSGGAADAAGSSRATGSGGNRFSKSTHGPPVSARGAQPAGRGRGGGGIRGSSAGVAVSAPPAHPDIVHVYLANSFEQQLSSAFEHKVHEDCLVNEVEL